MLSVAFNLAFDVIKTNRLAAALHYLIKHNTHKNIHHIISYKGFLGINFLQNRVLHPELGMRHGMKKLHMIEFVRNFTNNQEEN